MKKVFQGFAATLAVLVAGHAVAGPVTFDISAASTAQIVNVDGFGGIPAINLNPGLDSLNATLSAGETWEFDFFSITFPSFGAGVGTLDASLAFDAPTGASTADGTAVGGFFSFIVNGGLLTWTTQPGLFTLLDGTVYTVAFENLAGVTLGRSVDVRAYLTLHTEPVPAPGTLALLGLGLLGVGLMHRRRQAAMRKAS